MSKRSPSVWLGLPSLAVAIAVLAAAPHPAAQAPALPAALNDYLTRHVKLPAKDIARVSSGEPVTMLLNEGDPSKEVSVFGVVWIQSTPAAYVRALTGSGFALEDVIEY